MGSHIWRNHPDRLLFRKQYERSDTKELLWYKGTLFIDKLKCTRGNSKDDECYQELAEKIESLRDIHHSQRGWLVFYTRNLSTFPPEFIEQFEPEGLVLLNSERTTTESLLKGTIQKAKVISGITKKRGRKPKNPKYDEFVGILDDILEYGEDISLGKYVKKVQTEMGKRGLKKKNKNTGQEEGFIYTDKTIKTYIQKHPNYKKIQKRRENHKKA